MCWIGRLILVQQYVFDSVLAFGDYLGLDVDIFIIKVLLLRLAWSLSTLGCRSMSDTSTLAQVAEGLFAWSKVFSIVRLLGVDLELVSQLAWLVLLIKYSLDVVNGVVGILQLIFAHVVRIGVIVSTKFFEHDFVALLRQLVEGKGTWRVEKGATSLSLQGWVIWELTLTLDHGWPIHLPFARMIVCALVIMNVGAHWSFLVQGTRWALLLFVTDIYRSVLNATLLRLVLLVVLAMPREVWSLGVSGLQDCWKTCIVIVELDGSVVAIVASGFQLHCPTWKSLFIDTLLIFWLFDINISSAVNCTLLNWVLIESLIEHRFMHFFLPVDLLALLFEISFD